MSFPYAREMIFKYFVHGLGLQSICERVRLDSELPDRLNDCSRELVLWCGDVATAQFRRDTGHICAAAMTSSGGETWRPRSFAKLQGTPAQVP